MKYLDAEYKLRNVDEAMYLSGSKHVGRLQGLYGLEGTLRIVTKKEMPSLTRCVLSYSDHLQEVYEEGGGFYGLAFAAGIFALRKANPQLEVPSIEPSDWDKMMSREAELRNRIGLRTVEEIGGIGLLEIRDVNSGYVDGYQTAADTFNLSPYLGFTGLATVNAHDILHFASNREVSS